MDNGVQTKIAPAVASISFSQMQANMNAFIPGPMPLMTIAPFKTSKGSPNIKHPNDHIKIGCKNKEKKTITTIFFALLEK